MFYLKKSYRIPRYIIIKLIGGVVSIYSKVINYNFIWIFGLFGYIKKRFPTTISFCINYNWLFIRSCDICNVSSLLSFLKSTVYGLSKGFSFSLKIIGVGFKLKYILNRNWILVKLGFSHYFRIKLGFSEFKLYLIKKNILILFGYDNQFLKNLIYFIKSFRGSDSYKLKGFYFFDEFPKLKSGKKVQV